MDIWFTRSTDSGATFETPKPLSENHLRADASEIYATEGNLYIVWQDDTTGEFFTERIPDVLFTRSTDSGATFETAKKLDNEDIGFSVSPHIISSGTNVYVTWSNATDLPISGDEEDTNTKNTDIFFTRSTDSGATFETAKKLDNIVLEPEGNGIIPRVLSSNQTDDLAHSPVRYEVQESVNDARLCLSQNNVYSIWLDNNIESNYVNTNVFFTRSTDNGATFETPINLSNNNRTTISYDPQVQISDNRLYIVWVETYLSEEFDVFETFEPYEAKETNLVLSTIEINNNSHSTAVDGEEPNSICSEDIKYGYNDAVFE
jgi:hypothetical protein